MTPAPALRHPLCFDEVCFTMKLGLLLWLASLLPQPTADRVCLATTIYLEARSESALGQAAVAEVALRRRESGQWGSTLCSVLTARGQFALSTTSHNFIVDESSSWQNAWLVAGVAMGVWSLPPRLRVALVPKADHFFASTSSPPAWAKGSPLAVIGDHSFYRAN
jgi:spore germination cell wall hydrolase CwlJ-like protein